MLNDIPESTVEMTIEPDGLSRKYRWSKRALASGALAFSAIILILGGFALLLVGIPIALTNGLIEGSWQAAEQALAQLWRLSPMLLAAELVLAWLLVAALLHRAARVSQVWHRGSIEGPTIVSAIA